MSTVARFKKTLSLTISLNHQTFCSDIPNIAIKLANHHNGATFIIKYQSPFPARSFQPLMFPQPNILICLVTLELQTTSTSTINIVLTKLWKELKSESNQASTIKAPRHLFISRTPAKLELLIEKKWNQKKIFKPNFFLTKLFFVK